MLNMLFCALNVQNRKILKYPLLKNYHAIVTGRSQPRIHSALLTEVQRTFVSGKFPAKATHKNELTHLLRHSFH